MGRQGHVIVFLHASIVASSLMFIFITFYFCVIFGGAERRRKSSEQYPLDRLMMNLDVWSR